MNARSKDIHSFTVCSSYSPLIIDRVNLGYHTFILMWQEADYLGHSSGEVRHGPKAATGRGIVKVAADARGPAAADLLIGRASAAHGRITFDIHLE